MKGMKAIGFGLILGASFTFGFTWKDLRNGEPPSAAAIARLLGGGGSTASASQQFSAEYERILSGYYKSVDATDLKWSGMEGLVAALGDPHTMFLRPKVADEFQVETSAKLVGIGARLSSDELGARVATVFDGGPADRAGLKANDVVTTVDGKSVMGKPVDEIVLKIRGEEGTTVTLQVARQGVREPITMKIKRAQIVAPTVEQRFLEGEGIGYVKVVSFSEPTAGQFDRAIDSFKGKPMRGLVIDLRDNPGGLLETTVEMLSRFVEGKVVVMMKGRDGGSEVAFTESGLKRDFPYPVAVLMNDESASASEIFAGALQDYKLATLVGEHSYGKASVQNVRRLLDNSSVKITIARYLLPSGRDIGRKMDEDGQFLSGGLQPDVKIELPLDKPVVLGEPGSDGQLQAAIELLQKKASGR